jgi:predicted permease
MKFFHRLRTQFQKKELDQELSEELAFHIEQETEENIAAGMSAEEARYAALRKFGGVDQVKEEWRDAWGLRFVDTLLQDLGFGLRNLRLAPGFAAIAILTLALGIGCSMTMFGVVEGLIFDLPPIPRVEGLVKVFGVNYETGTDRNRMSIPNFLDIRARTTTFDDMAAFAIADKVSSDAEEPRYVSTQAVSANFFNVVGVEPKEGRGFGPDDERVGAPFVAVISDEMWRNRFGHSAGVLGKSIELDGISYTVVGIMPKGFWYPMPGVKVWTQLAMDTSGDRSVGAVQVIGHLRTSVLPAQAQSEIEGLMRSLELQFSDAKRKTGIRIVGVRDEQLKQVGLRLVFILGPAVLVLLIGCANITNLLLARGSARQAEFATRAALGAQRGRLVRQLLTENLLVALAGAALGTLGAWAGLAACRRFLSTENPAFVEKIHLDGRVLAFGLIAAILVPLVFGILPALRLSRTSLNVVLRSTGTIPNARISFRKLPLTVIEVALAMSLLMVAVLFDHTLVTVQRVFRPRIDTRNVVLAEISPPPQNASLHQLSNTFSTIPSVAALGVTDGLPLFKLARDTRPLEVEREGQNMRTNAIPMSVTPGFFDALQLSVLQGQIASGQELDGAVVSQAFAQPYGADNVLKLRIRRPGGVWLPVTGIVKDWMFDFRSEKPLPMVYFPFAKTETASQIVVRTRDGGRAIPLLRRAARDWNRRAIVDCNTVDQLVEAEIAAGGKVIYLLNIFGGLAVLLSTIGIYGVMSYSVARRTREIGIRIALGATPQGIVALVLRETMLLMLAGLLVGWLPGIGAGFVIRHELLGLMPYDPVTTALCAATILATGLLASYLPARRATRVDPMVALRYE